MWTKRWPRRSGCGRTAAWTATRSARDYCFNTGPFMSPAQFAEFVTPYLARLIQGYRDMGFYTVKHTDGNIMPILDQLVQAHPHALHSLDPQAGVDIAEVKRLYGDRVCLIGNVNCGLLDTGTEEECVESARYCLKHGMPGGGYIFSTSNCVYTGMRLSRYELIQRCGGRRGIIRGEAALSAVARKARNTITEMSTNVANGNEGRGRPEAFESPHRQVDRSTHDRGHR